MMGLTKTNLKGKKVKRGRGPGSRPFYSLGDVRRRLPEQEPLKSKAYDEERNSEVDCADYCIGGVGDTDGA